MNKRQRRKSDRYSIYTTFEGIPDPTAGAAISHACVTDIGWEQRLQENWRQKVAAWEKMSENSRN